MRGSRDYCQGVEVHLPENSSDNVVFFKSSIYLTEDVQWLFQRKLLFSKVSGGGGNFFQWGGGGGGPNANFYRNPHNL